MPTNNESLAASARMVDKLASENPDLDIPVDPEVADYMGAFADPALAESLTEQEDDDA